jgi:hypothetical protein
MGEWQRLRELASQSPFKVRVLSLRFVEDVCSACMDAAAVLPVVGELVMIAHAAAAAIGGQKKSRTRFGVCSATYAIVVLLKFAETSERVMGSPGPLHEVQTVYETVIDIVIALAQGLPLALESCQCFSQLLEALGIGENSHVGWKRLHEPLERLVSRLPLPGVVSALKGLESSAE